LFANFGTTSESDLITAHVSEELQFQFFYQDIPKDGMKYHFLPSKDILFHFWMYWKG
jgi:hypothetical protein